MIKLSDLTEILYLIAQIEGLTEGEYPLMSEQVYSKMSMLGTELAREGDTYRF